MKTTQRFTGALASALLALAATPAAMADELPDCLANPGTADFFGFTHQMEIFVDNTTWSAPSTSSANTSTPAL